MAKKYRCGECSFASEIEPGDFETCPGCGSNSIEYAGPRNNREMLRDLVDDADEMTLVFIRERLLSVVCPPYLTRTIEEVRAEFAETPMFGAGFADIYVRAAKEVNEALDFEPRPVEDIPELQPITTQVRQLDPDAWK